MTGYKVMRVSDDEKTIISGANSKLNFKLKCGIITMPGDGIYMSTNKDYVLKYYSGLADKEVLLTFDFNEEDIIWGNTNDVENEFSVKQAIIVNIEKLEE